MIELKRKRKRPMIPMSSMSDIGFLLLIFIMLISLINQRHEVPIEYPEAQILEKTQEKDNLEIWIEASGRISSEGLTLKEEALEGFIVEYLTEKPQARVHVIADKNTPYRHINTVLKTLQALQHRVVSFVVKEEL